VKNFFVFLTGFALGILTFSLASSFFDAFQGGVKSKEILLVCTMIVTGIFAGITRNIYENNKNIFHKKAVFLGLLATFFCPLFLKTISSDLLTKFFTDQFQPTQYFVLTSIFLLTAFFAKSFIHSLKDKFLKDLEDVKEQVEDQNEKILKSQYLEFSKDTKELLHNIISEYQDTEVPHQQLSSISSLGGEEYEAALIQLKTSDFLNFEHNSYKIQNFKLVQEIDKKYGPKYDA